MAFGARNWATAAVLLAAVVVALSGVQARRWWPLGGELPRDETPYSISGRDAVSAAEEARRAAAVALGDLGSLSAHAGRLLNMLRGVPWHEFRPSFAGSEDAAGLWFAVEHRANATRSAAVLALSDASQYAANDINLVVNNQSVSGDPAYYDSQGTQLSASGLKLLHDVEQMKLLLRRGRLPPAMRGIAADMEAALVLLRRRGVATSMPAILYPREWVLLAGAYNRLLYQVPPEESDLPVGVPLLNDAVDWKAKDEEFVRTNSQLGGKTGIVIIDDFLSQEALAVVRRVVWENTAWFDVRERYMGAYYWSGLKTEILARIGLALMDRLPQTIGNHTLHQIWSYKYGRSDYETDALRWPQDLLDADARTGPNGTARGINIHADQAVIVSALARRSAHITRRLFLRESWTLYGRPEPKLLGH